MVLLVWNAPWAAGLDATAVCALFVSPTPMVFLVYVVLPGHEKGVGGG